MSISEFQVSLGAVNHNLRLAAELGGDRAVLAAVKANAYGHGLTEVARSIEREGTAQLLGVALVTEASQLRAAGVQLPILKFTLTLADELDEALANDVTLTVADAAGIHAASRAAARTGVAANVHLKVDTGMRRIGAEPGQAPRLARLVAADPNLNLEGIYTHLPISDTPAGAKFTRAELDSFEQVVAAVTSAVGPVKWVHSANSGAVLSHELGSSNLIRPGIMIYGSYPDHETPHTRELVPVSRWTAPVTFVKKVRAGETVGYGRTWTAPADTWIATVAVGYGDGYSRLLSNKGRMLIAGRPRPVVGRVCMDQTMVDLGPDAPNVTIGEEAVLIGAQGEHEITVWELADLMGTIPYEVTCLITSRVRRTYVA